MLRISKQVLKVVLWFEACMCLVFLIVFAMPETMIPEAATEIVYIVTIGAILLPLMICIVVWACGVKQNTFRDNVKRLIVLTVGNVFSGNVLLIMYAYDLERVPLFEKGFWDNDRIFDGLPKEG